MNLSVRIFLGYFVLVGFAIWFVMRTFSAELVPGMRQSLEEVLVDTANLLAELVAEEVDQRRLQSGHFADAMASFAERRIDARIWFLRKRDPNLIVYITDAKGIVLYDSRGRDVGKDYSQWNDVLLTLRGKYGARTTREDEKDEFSSVMYVAAPIYRHDELIGVVTVGKPSVTVQPFVESATRNIKEKGVLMILAALAVGIIITYWLSMSIRKLTAYARAVRDGERPSVPRLREKELAQLADAMDAMRRELEGKDYVENYLHILTHEMKSPLAAIRGTAELLDEEMPLADRQRFIANIRSEANRLHQVVEQLLQLAVVEKQQGLSNPESVDVTAMIEELCEARQWRAEQDEIRYRQRDRLQSQGRHYPFCRSRARRRLEPVDNGPGSGGAGICARSRLRALLFPAAPCDRRSQQRSRPELRARGCPGSWRRGAIGQRATARCGGDPVAADQAEKRPCLSTTFLCG